MIRNFSYQTFFLGGFRSSNKLPGLHGRIFDLRQSLKILEENRIENGYLFPQQSFILSIPCVCQTNKVLPFPDRPVRKHIRVNCSPLNHRDQ
jgi:hypothetical protein